MTRDPYPEGWFCLARSREVRSGQVVTRRAFGRDFVLFRGESGEVAVVDPHCPHLGAHLGHGGTVVGETIRCPFHGFRWAADGHCAATGYPGCPRVRYRLGTWPAQERFGWIFVFFSHDRREPGWELPEVPQRGWTAPCHRRIRFRGHVQDAIENVVDHRHFGVVHGHADVSDPVVELDGVALRSTVRLSHPMLPFTRVRATLVSRVYGLGFTLMEIELPGVGLNYRLYSATTPVDEEAFDLSFGLSCPVGWRPASELLARLTMLAAVRDAEHDRPIWAHKIDVDPPRLVRGDGPIGAFRKYARRFYAQRKYRPALSGCDGTRIHEGPCRHE